MILYRCTDSTSDFYNHVGHLVNMRDRWTIRIRTWNRTIGWDIAEWPVTEWEQFHLRMPRKQRGKYIVSHNALLE